MDSKARYDILLLSKDLAVREALASEARAQFVNALVKEYSSVKDAVESHRVAWFNLIIVHGVQLQDCDCWRFVSMIRSGDFGFRDTPVFLLLSPELRDAFASLSDKRTVLLAADSSHEAIQQIATARDADRLPTLLLVEDEVRAATATARGLRKHFNVDIRHDGESALAAWKTRRHDLIVLDLMLPGMTGDEVLKAVMAEHPDQAVVILTAHNNHERHVDLVLAGAKTCISKPVRPHDFANICARVLSRHTCIRAACCADAAAAAVEQMSEYIRAAQNTLGSGRAGEATQHLKKAADLIPAGVLREDESQMI